VLLGGVIFEKAIVLATTGRTIIVVGRPRSATG